MKQLIFVCAIFIATYASAYQHPVCDKKISGNLELSDIVTDLCDNHLIDRYLGLITGVDRFLNLVDYKIMNKKLAKAGAKIIDMEILPLCNATFKRPELYKVQTTICNSQDMISKETFDELRPIFLDIFAAEQKYIASKPSKTSGNWLSNIYNQFTNNVQEAIDTPNTPLDHPSCYTDDELVLAICRVANFSNMPDLVIEKLQIIFDIN